MRDALGMSSEENVSSTGLLEEKKRKGEDRSGGGGGGVGSPSGSDREEFED